MERPELRCPTCNGIITKLGCPNCLGSLPKCIDCGAPAVTRGYRRVRGQSPRYVESALFCASCVVYRKSPAMPPTPVEQHADTVLKERHEKELLKSFLDLERLFRDET